MQNITSFRIDDQLKERFHIFCEDMDVSCSEMLRRMILLMVSKKSKYELSELKQRCYQ